MNLNQRKLRLIQFISELEDETFFDYIESVIDASGERFGVQLPEIQTEKIDEPENTTETSKKSKEELLAEFYAKTADFDDEEAIEQILEAEFTEREQLRILLLLRLEDVKNHPEKMIDEETFFRNLRNHKKHELVQIIHNFGG